MVKKLFALNVVITFPLIISLVAPEVTVSSGFFEMVGADTKYDDVMVFVMAAVGSLVDSLF